MTEFNRAQAKQAARRAMKAQRPHPMLITLLFIVLVNIGTQLISRILGAASGSTRMGAMFVQAHSMYEDPAAAMQYILMAMGAARIFIAIFVGGLVASILAALWIGVMRVGYSDFCLQMVQGRQPQTSTLFSAFPHWVGVLLTQFLAELFRALWALLLGVGLAAVIFVDAVLFIGFIESEAFFIIVLLVAYIAFIVGVECVTLRYALVEFLIADQGLTGMDTIRESKRLMKGNIGKLFLLQLSFIGWYLLEIAIVLVALVPGMALFYVRLDASSLLDPVSLVTGGALAILGLAFVATIIIGILNLWLTPYITGAQALFYAWTQGRDISARPDSFNGAQDGWGQPYDYTWTSGPTSGTGTGIGPGPKDDGHTPPPPKPPRPPRDDPWN